MKKAAVMKNSLFRASVAVLLLSGSAGADSLFSQKIAREGTLVAERKARFAVGDIITVLVREEVEATTTSNTNTKKESDVNSKANESENSFLVTPVKEDGFGILDAPQLPNWAIGTENEHKGTGSTKRSSTLTTTITCFVKEVLPNGNLMLEGNKRITVNKEDSLLVVGGLIRSKDVTAENTILSTQVADATVELRGKGPLWNNQRRGILTRALDWFSPF